MPCCGGHGGGPKLPPVLQYPPRDYCSDVAGDALQNLSVLKTLSEHVDAATAVACYSVCRAWREAFGLSCLNSTLCSSEAVDGTRSRFAANLHGAVTLEVTHPAPQSQRGFDRHISSLSRNRHFIQLKIHLPVREASEPQLALASLSSLHPLTQLTSLVVSRNPAFTGAPHTLSEDDVRALCHLRGLAFLELCTAVPPPLGLSALASLATASLTQLRTLAFGHMSALWRIPQVSALVQLLDVCPLLTDLRLRCCAPPRDARQLPELMALPLSQRLTNFALTFARRLARGEGGGGGGAGGAAAAAGAADDDEEGQFGEYEDMDEPWDSVDHLAPKPGLHVLIVEKGVRVTRMDVNVTISVSASDLPSVSMAGSRAAGRRRRRGDRRQQRQQQQQGTRSEEEEKAAAADASAVGGSSGASGSRAAAGTTAPSDKDKDAGDVHDEKGDDVAAAAGSDDEDDDEDEQDDEDVVPPYDVTPMVLAEYERLLQQELGLTGTLAEPEDLHLGVRLDILEDEEDFFAAVNNMQQQLHQHLQQQLQQVHQQVQQAQQQQAGAGAGPAGGPLNMVLQAMQHGWELVGGGGGQQQQGGGGGAGAAAAGGAGGGAGAGQMPPALALLLNHLAQLQLGGGGGGAGAGAGGGAGGAGGGAGGNHPHPHHPHPPNHAQHQANGAPAGRRPLDARVVQLQLGPLSPHMCYLNLALVPMVTQLAVAPGLGAAGEALLPPQPPADTRVAPVLLDVRGGGYTQLKSLAITGYVDHECRPATWMSRGWLSRVPAGMPSLEYLALYDTLPSAANDPTAINGLRSLSRLEHLELRPLYLRFTGEVPCPLSVPPPALPPRLLQLTLKKITIPTPPALPPGTDPNSPAALAALPDLPDLTHLWLFDCAAPDLTVFRRATRLEDLRLGGTTTTTPLRDLLAPFRCLRGVILDVSHSSAPGWWSAGQLSALSGLRCLRQLQLDAASLEPPQPPTAATAAAAASGATSSSHAAAAAGGSGSSAWAARATVADLVDEDDDDSDAYMSTEEDAGAAGTAGAVLGSGSGAGPSTSAAATAAAQGGQQQPAENSGGGGGSSSSSSTSSGGSSGDDLTSVLGALAGLTQLTDLTLSFDTPTLFYDPEEGGDEEDDAATTTPAGGADSDDESDIETADDTSDASSSGAAGVSALRRAAAAAARRKGNAGGGSDSAPPPRRDHSERVYDALLAGQSFVALAALQGLWRLRIGLPHGSVWEDVTERLLPALRLALPRTAVEMDVL
ncbi:hypothetical protein Agub_g10001 [Astrephomene gubernaculifera]|uniref:Uncharacterized protein n=1 Tax=Astrephomene gubernaculifera TaxID=47775 RepID=A0AAD3DU66_9CHLO|nr:hypothetical protein Agub_g10001 [Astrephomene gubernaculifera]